ncbi:1-acylglycerol-3-phosphate O-acyltransferase [Serratia entomophila]|uniref:1-acylglycerol-3-phosphate O-acyltransferase n=1 Tax=Serratia entomophila TaxID=42906 RepID=UPI00217A992A|nr:1-acylglycerol-3-phosphate O-acyltransferase [Serratia entomophila]CAI0871169.1 1-acyl-sn-glycerol-3-phosphate acyltransferase [Serratia entomophila]CAI1513538.1 1-acyl-sn-glycerol-3-phosphate acyltransferase [Serratia entomophila]CAI1589918.1 1-acyl-sn-glycerol-3-phosphate acyltransferase [Serratia entomophila]CAI1821910.1 1-acyl-sn-glycerol-3-phosphate acyltransferase [Serratia entomophila]CAI1883323.1 1-acyl-sn-glycerol-3-phosphate acyltransferase [Serratia entomophila]
MVAIVRLILMGIFIVLSSIVVLLVCLFRPRNIMNVHFAARLYSKISWLLGVKITVTGRGNIPSGSCVFVANHQSNYDIFFLTAAVPPGAVSIGKKSILYFPFFGLIYWLSGNIFIERGNKIKAMQALQKTKERMLKDNISVWLFPEGTRNYSKGLKPFNTGAFHLARNAGFPLVPVSASNYYGSFKLNKIDNGEVIIKFLPAVPHEIIATLPVREVVATVYAQMSTEIETFDKELIPSGEDFFKVEER